MQPWKRSANSTIAHVLSASDPPKYVEFATSIWLIENSRYNSNGKKILLLRTINLFLLKLDKSEMKSFWHSVCLINNTIQYVGFEMSSIWKLF